jgi:hypothetical protein
MARNEDSMTNGHSRLVGAAALLLLLPLTRAHAWNNVGHMVVAKLAFDELDDGQKVKVGKLLRQHPHYAEFLTKNRPEGVSEEEWAFLKAATWPDWVRPRRNDPRGERVTRYHRGPDHYINFPLVRPGDEQRFNPATLGPNPDTPDILSALKQRVGELTESTASAEDRAVALCWLLHLIGDLHQPLHSTALFSTLFPQGDRGGNLFGVRVNGRKTNLHAYWDNLLGDDPNYLDESAEHHAKLYKQVKELTESLRAPEYQRDKLPELAKNTTFPSWARESFELARDVAYGKLTVEPVLVSGGTVPEAAKEAGAEYDKLAQAIARRRVALAGHRLADRLKAVLREP